MKTLWFVVPVHGRLSLARVCLRQLRRTCDVLYENGVAASAVIVSDRNSLAALDVVDLRFGWVERDNDFTSAKFNDGIQLATDPAYNPYPVDYVVPCGSDDWIDHRLFLGPLPEPNDIHGFKWMSFVREDGRVIRTTYLGYEGGSGVRIIPRQLVAPLGYRPASEDRERGCDSSIMRNIRAYHGDTLKIRHFDTSPYWIVDWKSECQLNSYELVPGVLRAQEMGDPFEELVGFYPPEALEEMGRVYFGAKAA